MYTHTDTPFYTLVHTVYTLVYLYTHMNTLVYTYYTFHTPVHTFLHQCLERCVHIGTERERESAYTGRRRRGSLWVAWPGL